MSSGGWEIVGKNKKDKAGAKAGKITKPEKKRLIENTPKVEDFLPLSQVKSYYENLQSSNKENKKPTKEKDNKSKENEDKKKQKQHQNEKKKEGPKEKLPKSIEDALNAIDPKEFQELLTIGSGRFTNAPLIWLKDLVAFLNMKVLIENDDPTFSKKPAGYPLSVMPKSLRSTFEKAINLSGAQNTQLFYEYLLTAMVTDMSKNIPVIGYKIAIQILAKHNPQMSTANISKLISLRKSYQNRKSIGLSLLWALAQSGQEDFGVGIKVWHEVMSSLLEAKNYSQYVAQIMLDYLDQYESYSNLNTEIYVDILDDLISGKINIPVAQQDKCTQIVEKIRKILFQNKNANYRKLFESLTIRLIPKSSNSYKDEVVKALVSCLVADENLFSVWKSMHQKHPYCSNALLKCINKNWVNLKQTMSVTHLSGTLTAILTSHDLSKKSKDKDDSLLIACSKEAKALLTKMKQGVEEQERTFPWRSCFFFILFVVGAVLLVDYQKHGSIQHMRTNFMLRNNKVVEYGQNAWIIVTKYTNQGFETIEKNYPEQYKVITDQAKSYSKLLADMAIIVKNSVVKIYGNITTYVTTKQPIVEQSIEDFAPGMLSKIREQSSKGLELLTTYYAKLGEQVIELSTTTIRWMEMNVFVGKFSPESLQNYASHVLKTTQNFASQTYDWIYEKMQTFSNIQ